MKETMIMNVASVTACSIAIAIACIVTNSAWPLCGFLLIPRWSYNQNNGGQVE